MSVLDNDFDEVRLQFQNRGLWMLVPACPVPTLEGGLCTGEIAAIACTYTSDAQRWGQDALRMSDLKYAIIPVQAALDAEAAMEAEPAADGDADDVANNQADREAEVRVASGHVPDAKPGTVCSIACCSVSQFVHLHARPGCCCDEETQSNCRYSMLRCPLVCRESADGDKRMQERARERAEERSREKWRERDRKDRRRDRSPPVPDRCVSRGVGGPGGRHSAPRERVMRLVAAPAHGRHVQWSVQELRRA